MLYIFSLNGIILLSLIEFFVASESVDLVRLSNNYRELQDERSAKRTIYKSTGTGSCDDISWGPTPSRSASFPHMSSTKSHWVYMDQEHWTKYNIEPNECGMEEEPEASYPGESPININATRATVTNNSTIQLSGFSFTREDLQIINNGHGIKIYVCRGSAHDCRATGSFGIWPKQLRGITDDSTIDEYYLKDITFHWGSDESKGSEHAVCGKSAAGEVQMSFSNSAEVTSDRSNPYSGTKYVIISTMLQVGEEDSQNYSSIFDKIPLNEYDTDKLDIKLDSLLALDYDTKYFTYAGSLTTPPCWQQVTWFISQNSVSVSKSQLDKLRDATMPNHQHDNSYEALMFPFVAMVMGTATEHVLDRHAPWIPYTVTILLEGWLVDVLANFDRANIFRDSDDEHGFVIYIYPESDSTMQRSIDMWANIDGHLLLYAFLPALLFGEAMTLNVHMFTQTFFQCLVLACPGVIFGTFVTGFCAMELFPYDWDFNFSMVFGSILAATDPVAVVALLKSVGASSKLTLQITGESLINDGTAIVLFSLFMKFYEEIEMDPTDIILFFLQMTIAGPLIGICLGIVAVKWIGSARRRFSHSDITVQTSITLVCAFMAFFLAESESKSSGVLCTVASGILLAKYAWPVVISHETLENVWHTVEYFGNTLIFFLAGVITRRAMFSPHVTSKDYGWCVIMYLLMMLIRAIMVFLLYPFLKCLGYGTNRKDAIFMVYGGLRGAVGLALAIYVRENCDDEKAGDQLVFHVCGLAFLTLIVNGTTSGLVLRALGLVGLPELKIKMIDEVKQRIVETAEKDYITTCNYLHYDAREALSLISNLRFLMEKENTPIISEAPSENSECEHCSDGHVHHKPKEYNAERIESFLKTQEPADPERLQLMRETYYRIVRATYWEMIEDGHLPAGGTATLELLKSVDVCLDDTERALWDWDVVKKTAEYSDEDVIYDDIFRCVSRILPKSWTWAEEQLYLKNFQQQETAYYICHGFSIAHQEAQEKLAVFYGDDATVDTPEEGKVIIESLKMIKEAVKMEEEMSQSLIKHIKNMFIADKMINMQQMNVMKIIHQGVLAEAEAERLLRELEDDAHNIDKERQRRAVKFSKSAAAGSLEGDFDLEHVGRTQSKELKELASSEPSSQKRLVAI
jgi:NhaP-type Na+/H+ or K+/H+ antiporter/carbonic anhydrase